MLPPLPVIFQNEIISPLPGEIQLGRIGVSTLQTGELIVKTCSKVPSRSGRSGVKVRVFGDSSFGWAEATTSWGATPEAFITNHQCTKSIRSRFKLPIALSYDSALGLSPAGQPSEGTPYAITSQTWDGILCATIRGDDDSTKAKVLFKMWQPLIAIFALPSCLARSKIIAFVGGTSKACPFQDPEYQRLMVNVKHNEVGG